MISELCFPTPHLALRTNDTAQWDQIAQFACRQADEAERIAAWLHANTRGLDAAGRAAAFESAYQEIIAWRCEVASQRAVRLGVGIPVTAERYRTPITDTTPNYDRIGVVGRMRDGATWDPDTRTYQGGEPTPASRVLERAGRVALSRFDREAPTDNMILNEVTLPDGEIVAGSRIVRGATATVCAQRLADRITARGLDASRVETGGQPMYTITAPEATRARIHAAAMRLLADPGDDPAAAWCTAAYLVFQSPLTKKGSDAVNRVFLVAAGAVLLGVSPVLRHDIDLHAYTADQRTFEASAAALLPAVAVGQ